MQRYKEALESFDKAIAIDSRDPRAWKGKALALKALGRDREAEDALAGISIVDPSP